MIERAKRFNSGKLRYELIPTGPMAKIAKVYTEGAHKYSVYKDESGNLINGKDIKIEDVAKRKLQIVEDGADNWRLGQDWMGAAASAKRHIEAFMAGEDLDELGTYHLANAAWGMIALLEFYDTHPELDNRKHKYLTLPKIGLDIDEVIADFVGSMMERFPEIKERPVYWHDPVLGKCFEEIKDDVDFWLNVKTKVNPLELPFEPHCYITSRTISQEVTKKWLISHGFPDRPLYTVGHNQSKIEAAKDAGINRFVDDRFENFVDLNKNGICCFLMDAPHNQRYDVGYRRIKSLKELV